MLDAVIGTSTSKLAPVAPSAVNIVEPDTTKEPVISADPENGNPAPEPPEPEATNWFKVWPTYWYPEKNILLPDGPESVGAAVSSINCKTPVL